MKGWSTRNNNLGLMLIGGIITIQWAKNGKKECKPERFKNQCVFFPHCMQASKDHKDVSKKK